MQVVVLMAVAVVLLLVALVLTRRERVRRNRLDRHGLDHLRRLYRRDNPRGPGLEPLFQDQQQRIRPHR